MRLQDVCPRLSDDTSVFNVICHLQGHWLGCMYYGLAAYHAFDQSLFRLNWVDAWVQQTDVDFSWLDSSPTYDYVVRSIHARPSVPLALCNKQYMYRKTATCFMIMF